MELHRPVIDEQHLPFFAQHDLACPVCQCAKAVLNCNNMVFEPCWDCQSRGWRTQQHGRVFLWAQRWYARNGGSVRYFLFLVLYCTLAAVLTACPKVCAPKTAQCLGTTVQLCRPDGKWARVADCAKVDVKQPWGCCCQDSKTCRCVKPAAPVQP